MGSAHAHAGGGAGDGVARGVVGAWSYCGASPPDQACHAEVAIIDFAHKHEPRIPVHDGVDIDGFLADFFEPEQPILFKQIARTESSAEALCRRLNARIAADEARVSLQTLCWDVSPSVIEAICPIPRVVASALDPERVFVRERHVRLWFNREGHRTLWHYDGHSMHVFNLQLKGRKRWRIVAPETPLLCAPLTSFCMFDDYALERRRSYEFETHEGDMVFIPRHWYHSVDSIDELNININWVMTPRRATPSNPTARREAELTWLKSRTRWAWPRSVRDYNDAYGGVGRPAIDLLTQTVSPWAGAKRAGIEALKLPLALAGYWSLRPNLQAANRSNRVLRELVLRERVPSPSRLTR